MTDIMKQRIVGAAVVVVVLAIFLPILLHKSKPMPKLRMAMNMPQMQLQLPAKTDVQINKSLPVTQPLVKAKVQETTPSLIAKAPATPVKAMAPVSAAASPASAPAVVPVVVHRPKHHAKPAAHRGWVIQLASFSNPHNAKHLVARLHRHGITAYSQAGGHGRITRVFVGPEQQHHHAEVLRHRLAKSYHLNGVVRRARA